MGRALDRLVAKLAGPADEARDDHGRWSAGGSSGEADTPVPAAVGAALDVWVRQGGSGQVSAAQRAAIARAVSTHGERLPVPVARGVNEQASVEALQRKYVPGRSVEFAPASFSADVSSALPYAENGDGQPVVLHVEGGPKALNVSERAGRVAGFYEQEWVLAGRFRVAGPPTMDSEGFMHVRLRPGG